MIQLNIDNVWSKLIFSTKQRDNIGAVLSKYLIVDIPSAKYTWAFKSGQWDGKTQLFQTYPDQFVFLTGLLPIVLGALAEAKITIDSTFLDNRRMPSSPKLLPYSAPLRDYQADAVYAGFSQSLNTIGWWPRGILQAACGSGKTEMAVAMYQMNPISTFFLVHRKDLLIQAQERFEKYKVIPGMLGAGEWSPDPKLNIATFQTIHSVLKRDDERANELRRLIRNTHQVFFDECHLMASNVDKGNEFTKIAAKFHNAYCRWGLTATPFMREKYDNLLLQGVSSDVYYSISNAKLIEMGYLSAPKVIMRKVPGKLPIYWEGGKNNSKKAGEYWRMVHDKGVRFNPIRNNLIVDEMIEGPFPMLILVKTVEQGKFIQHLAGLRGLTHVLFYTGKNTAKQRRAAVAGMQSGKIPIVMATTIFDEGIDIPELRKLIFGSGGASQVKMLQRIGRALRIAKGKHTVDVIDFQDGHHTMLEKHAKARERCWKTEGFEVVK